MIRSAKWTIALVATQATAARADALLEKLLVKAPFPDPGHFRSMRFGVPG